MGLMESCRNEITDVTVSGRTGRKLRVFGCCSAESWFNAPSYCEVPQEPEPCPDPDAGLLGRSYGDFQLLRLDVSSDVPGVDFDAKGFQTSFNIPGAVEFQFAGVHGSGRVSDDDVAVDDG